MELMSWYWTHTSDNSLVIQFKNGTEFIVSPENLAGILSTFPGNYREDILEQFGKSRSGRVRSVTQSDE